MEESRWSKKSNLVNVVCERPLRQMEKTVFLDDLFSNFIETGYIRHTLCNRKVAMANVLLLHSTNLDLYIPDA